MKPLWEPFRDEWLKEIPEADRDRFVTYFSALPNSTGIISGKAGARRREVSAAVIAMMRDSVGPIYVTTPFHGATTNIARSVQVLSDSIARKLRLKRPIADLMVVRAYSFDVEVEACLATLRGDIVRPRDLSGPWDFPRSLCYWALMALGCESETQVIPAMSEHASQDLRELYTDLENFANDEDSEDFGRTFKEWSEYSELLTIARGRTPMAEYLKTEKTSSLRRILQSFMSKVANCADVLVITSCHQYGKTYRNYSDKIAKGFVIEQASRLALEDGLRIVAYTPRPFVLVGDDEERSTIASTARRSSAVDAVAEHAKLVSIMAPFIQRQYPVLRVDTAPENTYTSLRPTGGILSAGDIVVDKYGNEW